MKFKLLTVLMGLIFLPFFLLLVFCHNIICYLLRLILWFYKYILGFDIEKFLIVTIKSNEVGTNIQ